MSSLCLLISDTDHDLFIRKINSTRKYKVFPGTQLYHAILIVKFM